MPHGDVAVTCVSGCFDSTGLRQPKVNYSFSQFSFNDLESIDALHRSRSGATKEHCSHCVFARPWSIKTSVEGCPGPGKVRIDVVSVSEHRGDPRACGSESGISEADASISEQEGFHVRHRIADRQSTHGVQSLGDERLIILVAHVARHHTAPLNRWVLNCLKDRWGITTDRVEARLVGDCDRVDA